MIFVLLVCKGTVGRPPLFRVPAMLRLPQLWSDDAGMVLPSCIQTLQCLFEGSYSSGVGETQFRSKSELPFCLEDRYTGPLPGGPIDLFWLGNQ